MDPMNFLRRRLFVPIWVAKDRSPRLKYMRQLERSQYFDLERLRELQFSKLKRMLKYAYENTHYYREIFQEAGIDPARIQDEADFKKIPVLKKAHLRRHHQRFVSDPYRDKRLVPFKTGGSTGQPVIVLKDFETIELGVAAAYRSFKWAGWRIGEPMGRVWGNPPSKSTIKAKLRNLLIDPEIFLDTMRIEEKEILDFVKKWKKFKPTVLHGHSHSIFIFASFCEEKGIEDITPKGIVSTSMMLMPRERTVIERVFNCKVTDFYGSEEVGLIACQCENHKGMHLNMENVYVELVNMEGKDVTPGEMGTVLVTSLINKAMPLIRYQIGDMAIPSRETCGCGRGLACIEKVTGRVADFLVRKNGSLVAGVSLVERTLTAYPGISQMQLVQEDIDNLIVRIVRSSEYKSETGKLLTNELKNSVGPDINVHLAFVERIAPGPSGKYRFSISKVPNPYMNF